MKSELGIWITAGGILLSVVIAPVIRWFWRWVIDSWREAQLARLSKLFVTRKEYEMQFEELTQTQSAQHEENKRLLRSQQEEGMQREGRIVKTVNDSTTTLGKRIDDLFKTFGERRTDRR